MTSRYFVIVPCLAALTFCFGGTARAAYFTDLGALGPMGYNQAFPTGINSSGVVTMQGTNSAIGLTLPTNTYIYTGGTNGTVANISSLFSTYATHTAAAPMNASGQIAIDPNGTDYGILYSGGTNGTVTAYRDGSNTTFSLAINNNGDEAGFYHNSSTICIPYVYTGGTVYPLNMAAGGDDDYIEPGGCSICALNTSGQAVGVAATGGPADAHAAVWTYTISGGSVTSQTATDLQPAVTAAFPTALSSNLVSINSSGLAVGEWGPGGGTVLVGLANPGGAFTYNVNTETVTPLPGFYIGMRSFANINYYSGFQAINDSGEVVGCIANAANTEAEGTTSAAGGYDAAIWKNGSITDLNTLYARALAGTGFTLDNATAIDDNGDIAGYGHDAAGNVEQAFQLQALLPGDANEDGRVDINDLTIVLSNYGQTGTTWSQGEFTGDGRVDINDLTIVLAHYNQSTGSSAGYVSAVPEPGALGLALAAALVGLMACARRNRQP